MLLNTCTKTTVAIGIIHPSRWKRVITTSLTSSAISKPLPEEHPEKFPLISLRSQASSGCFEKAASFRIVQYFCFHILFLCLVLSLSMSKFITIALLLFAATVQAQTLVSDSTFQFRSFHP